MGRATQFECLQVGILASGNPISTGWARFYEAGTSTLKNAYSDKDKSSSFTKLELDSDARGVAFGDGIYKIRFYDGDPDNGGMYLSIELDNIKCTATRGEIRTVTASTDDLERDDEFVMADTTSNSITLTLPDVDTVDDPITVKKIHASNTVTIDTTDSQLIDGESSITLTANKETVTLYPDQSADAWRQSLNLPANAISGDSTAGRVLRMSRLIIEDGTDADSLKCTLSSTFNGDTISETDNITGGTVGNFSYTAAAAILYILDAGITGTVVGAIATMEYNASATSVLVDASVSGANIALNFTTEPAGAAANLDNLVDTGQINVDLLYITDA